MSSIRYQIVIKFVDLRIPMHELPFNILPRFILSICLCFTMFSFYLYMKKNQQRRAYLYCVSIILRYLHFIRNTPAADIELVNDDGAAL